MRCDKVTSENKNCAKAWARDPRLTNDDVHGHVVFPLAESHGFLLADTKSGQQNRERSFTPPVAATSRL
jgi:hypothetical protein